MRVLLTGAGGFVGAHMLAHLMKNTNWEVVIIDSFRHHGKTDRLRDLLDTHPEYKERMTVLAHDLTVPISDTLDHSIGHIDYVLSIASESHVDRSISDPRPFIENNVSLMLTLLEWLRTRPEIKKFIQISTDEVYGPTEDGYVPCKEKKVCVDGNPKNHKHLQPIDHAEGEPHRPSNPYSASKSAQEQICYSYWRTYNLPIVITNTMNMYGELQDTEKFVPKIIKAIIEDKPINVHVSPEGVPGSRYYLHARNQCDALLFLLNNHTPTRYPARDMDRFNVVSEDEIDNMQMVEIISGFMFKKANVVKQNFHESRPGHDLRYGLDGTKLKELGWTPPISFHDSLKSTVEWYLREENKGWLV